MSLVTTQGRMTPPSIPELAAPSPVVAPEQLLFPDNCVQAEYTTDQTVSGQLQWE